MGPFSIACFFLYSGESLSSGFCGGTGPPGFRADTGPAGGFALVSESAALPFGSGVVLVFNFGNPPGLTLMESIGDRLG